MTKFNLCKPLSKNYQRKINTARGNSTTRQATKEGAQPQIQNPNQTYGSRAKLIETAGKDNKLKLNQTTFVDRPGPDEIGHDENNFTFRTNLKDGSKPSVGKLGNVENCNNGPGNTFNKCSSTAAIHNKSKEKKVSNNTSNIVLNQNGFKFNNINIFPSSFTNSFIDNLGKDAQSQLKRPSKGSVIKPAANSSATTGAYCIGFGGSNHPQAKSGVNIHQLGSKSVSSNSSREKRLIEPHRYNAADESQTHSNYYSHNPN